MRRTRMGGALAAAMALALGVMAYTQTPTASGAEPRITSFVPPPATAKKPAADESDKAENPYIWKPRTTTVAVFKNGLGFFTQEGEVALRDGWCLAQNIPPAAFGTLAVYSLNPDETVDIIGAGPGEVVEFDGKDQPSDLQTKRTRLEATKGMNVSLTYLAKGVSRSASGKLLSIGPEFVALQGPENTFAVPLDTLNKLQLLDLPLRIHVSSDKGASPKSTRLGMAYLRKGITWIPEYTIKVTEEQSASLTLRGTLVNEADDLVHCDVQFVVGVPHFAHTDFLSPISVGQVIRTIGAAVAPSVYNSQIMSNAMITNIDNSYRSGQFIPGGGNTGEEELRKILGGLPKTEGPGGTDYAVYTRKDLTVRHGEKAIVTFFLRKVHYTHLYRLAVPEEITHSLVLENDTDTPWTTGPFVAVSDTRPLSEDLLKYTPRGGKCEIPVTAAVNIASSRIESESDRKLKVYSPNNRDTFFDLVTVKGEIKLRNFEKLPADIVVTTNLPGKPLEASDGGVPTTDTSKLKLIERAGSFKWEIKLGPDETKVLTYSYERYVPSL